MLVAHALRSLVTQLRGFRGQQGLGYNVGLAENAIALSSVAMCTCQLMRCKLTRWSHAQGEWFPAVRAAAASCGIDTTKYALD